MPAVTVRNISVETHRALKQRAARRGNSTEAEIRAILDEAVRPEKGLGTRLQELGRKYGPLPEIKRDQTPLEPAIFE
ncbi:MAG TPA: plasmid stability protein [Acidobacteriaceae bacterium]